MSKFCIKLVFAHIFPNASQVFLCLVHDIFVERTGLGSAAAGGVGGAEVNDKDLSMCMICIKVLY